MIIESIRIGNLNGKGEFELRFNPDINVLTGKNGSGKTTILKATWYAISGNIEHLINEVDFSFFEITTNAFFLSLKKQT